MRGLHTVMRSAMGITKATVVCGTKTVISDCRFTSTLCRKMNGDIHKPLFRGSSVQQLMPSRKDNLVGGMEDHQVTFAESFTTFTRQPLQKLSEIKEEDQVDSSALTGVIDELLLLKDRSTSTLTIERLAKKFIHDYINIEDKNEVLVHLATKYRINDDEVRSKAKEVFEVQEAEGLARAELQLRTALDPPYNWLFSKMAQVSVEGVKFLSDLRADILKLLGNKNLNSDHRLALRSMSNHLKDLLGHWFSAGLLDLEQITWQSPCSILQKISDYEAVHPVRNWTDLKARVGPYRRCFVFKHRSMPGEPIVVLHVALTTEITGSISTVVKHHRQVKKTASVDVGDLYNINEEETYKGSAGVEDPALCSTAIFYSITSTQTGLQGIELGNSLIKQAVKKLKDEFPTMSQFSTLSPIPGFKTWLMTTLQMARKGQGREVLNDEEKAKILKTFYGPTDDFYDSLCTAFKSNQWAQNEKLRDALELPLMRLCSQYLFLEKRRNFALDPVANFHLRNGSTMWRLNWWADLSPRGLNNSCGIMVNYRYYLDKLESNSTQYQESKTIDTSEQIRQLAAQAQVLMIKPDDQAAKL